MEQQNAAQTPIQPEPPQQPQWHQWQQPPQQPAQQPAQQPPPPPPQWQQPQQPQPPQQQWQQPQQQWQQPQQAPQMQPPEPPKKKRRIPLVVKILGGCAIGIGLIVGGIILVVSLLLGGAGKEDFFKLGDDEVPSVKYILGEARDVVSSSTSTSSGATQRVIQYKVDSNQNVEMEKYSQALVKDYGFYQTTDTDFSGRTGTGFQFARESDEEDYIIIVNIDYDRNGYTLTLTRDRGTLTVFEPATPPPSPPPSPPPEPTPTPMPDSPTPTPETPAPTPDPPAPTPPSSFVMYADGGMMWFDGPTEISFTPNHTGIWVLYTKDNETSDPMLAMSERGGAIFSEDDDGMGDLNALLVEDLTAGVTYTIHLDFYDGDYGSCTLVAKRPLEISPNGGSIAVEAVQGFKFTPAQSGTWELITSNNGDYDPVVGIFDSYFDILEMDDDGAGDLNSLILIDLIAGETYHILAAHYGEGLATYTLTVTLK